jgi:hypothetical protein
MATSFSTAPTSTGQTPAFEKRRSARTAPTLSGRSLGGDTVELQCRELRDPKTGRPIPYELHFDVDSGENTLDIDLDKKLARDNTDGLFGSISLPSGTTRRNSGDD